MHRTHKLDEIDEKLIGKSVTLAGWVDTIRDHNNVLFIDLRDRYGKVQCVILKKNDDFEPSSEQKRVISHRGEHLQVIASHASMRLVSGSLPLSLAKCALNASSLA